MPLFKISGLIFVFGACALSGLLKAENLKRRSQRLEEILKSLSRLGELVRIGGYEITELINLCFDSKVIKNRDGNFFISEEYLLKEDTALLKDFFGGFGTADKEGEYERTRLYYSLLKQQYTAALRSYSELGRLYCTLGLLGGLILCIFLM